MELRFSSVQKLYITCFFVFLFFWLSSFLRHYLLQSNAYDLGLFDQWIWLASRGLPPYSSMEGVHILADHGAWLLFLGVLPYWLYPSVQWLLASQAAALSFTAIPFWALARQAGLSIRLSWLVCWLWWLQPVVFNVNLFDFHPEVWVMPVLVFTYWLSRANKPLLWFLSLVLMLGARDGLLLVVAGLGLEQFVRRKWTWGISALILSASWLLFITRWLYPSLTGVNNGPKAAQNLFSYLGDNVNEIILNVFTRPSLILQNIDLIGGIVYLLLISIAVAPFWKKISIPVLIGSIPLVIINLLSTESPQRTLIHHYSLPIAVIVIVATIDSLSLTPNKFYFYKLLWASICWAALAKPWFFTGPYLQRINIISDLKQAINEVPEFSRLATTSYLVPHFSQREKVGFPVEGSTSSVLENWDVLLLNPKDPGWASSTKVQNQLLIKARKQNWLCDTWPSGLELCKAPSI